MAGRRSVWSNERVIALSDSFVPVTDEVWRLQRGTDAECLHFQAMADGGHYKAKGGTRQGIYVLTARGTLLASINTLNPVDVLEMMEAGLAGWKATSPADRALPDDFEMPRRRWESSYPDDGVVLRSWTADLGVEAQRERRNRDHVWFSRAEARGWLGDDLAVGAEHSVSSHIVDRLCGLHLVDNVLGQTIPFAPEEVGGSQLTTTVTDVADGIVTFRIEGRTAAETDGTWKMGDNGWTPVDTFPRSVTTTVLGKGRFDTARQRFEQLEFVAVGERTGRTNLNGRGDDVGPSAIGFLFELAPDRASERVPPAFISIYDADWVVDPR